MKTPHAILIGLSLIAAAIFFKDTAVKPAHAFGGPDGFACWAWHSCYVFKGDTATVFGLDGGGIGSSVYNWRTGQRIN